VGHVRVAGHDRQLAVREQVGDAAGPRVRDDAVAPAPDHERGAADGGQLALDRVVEHRPERLRGASRADVGEVSSHHGHDREVLLGGVALPADVLPQEAARHGVDRRAK